MLEYDFIGSLIGGQLELKGTVVFYLKLGIEGFLHSMYSLLIHAL